MDIPTHPSTDSFPDRPGSGPSDSGPQVPPGPPAASARWAPWWVYLVVLLGANYLRASLMPVGTVPEPVVVVIALVQAAVLFAVVTAGWRLVRRGARPRGQ